MEDKITAVAACSSCSRTFETGKIEIILTFKISGKDPSSIFANSRVHQHSDSQEPEPTYFLAFCPTCYRMFPKELPIEVSALQKTEVIYRPA